MTPEYARSEHITDRSSKFIGYFSKTMSRVQLQALPEIKSASHKMAAWRVGSKQKTLTQSGHTTIDVGYDEDGEKGSGWRLKRILEEGTIIGVIVVARWYGGVMLGPKRWEHIEDVAKEAIARWNAGTVPRPSENIMVQTPPSSSQPLIPFKAPPAPIAPAAVPSIPPTDQNRQREELITELEDRDNSITVLRNHLEVKKAMVTSSQPLSSQPNSSSAGLGKILDYASISLERLQALDKARDATIAYLLKELDKVDQEQKEEDELNAAFKEASDRRELEDAWSAMEVALTKEQQQETRGATNSKRKRPQEGLFEEDEDEDAFEAAWEANETLLSPKKSKGVQVDDDDLPPSPSRKRTKNPRTE